ncbi:MAG: LysM peptidoglycan-binding domain-containing protein [Candidatus Roizmanbacteria bacterium]|nr:LysM peptidoglycan-binding domain-containing protein [Candidatus Roizmanbacteria bacterium]
MARKKQSKKTVKKNVVQDFMAQNDLQELKRLVTEKREALYIGAITLLIGIGIGLMIPKQYTPQSSEIKEMKVSAVPSKDVSAESYTLQEGESLSDVAEKFYGDPQLYTKIAEYNNIANPDVVAPGTMLRIEKMAK